MNTPNAPKQQSLWFYSVLPAVILNVGSLCLFGFYYATAAMRQVPVAQADQDNLSFGLYVFIFIIELVFAISLFVRERQAGRSLALLFSSGSAPMRIRLLPFLLLFVILNSLFLAYVAFSGYLRGGWPTMPTLATWQRLFLVMAVPLGAGFCEEIIWRGYLISQWQARGYTGTKAILLSAISFAFIHGIFLPDKLILTFLFGVVAGVFYVKERNLLPLIITHTFIDMWSFGLSVFSF